MPDKNNLKINRAADVCVCLLAHNEEKHIARTILAVLNGTEELLFPVYVYANGCTDLTANITLELAEKHGNVYLRDIPVASKPNAWNTALAEQRKDFLIFADGDVIPDPGAVFRLIEELRNTPGAIIATCRQVPILRGINWQQKLVGILQMPLAQDFLAGGFYAVKRQALVQMLEEKGFSALPPGLTGEDRFLDIIVGKERLIVSDCRSAYEPPAIADYCRYLARMRWQNEQIALLLHERQALPARGITGRLTDKFKRCQSKWHFPVMLMVVMCRNIFRLIAAPVIRRKYRELGPVREDGTIILQRSTRSVSSK
jgi:glycosyltransferase involved in cell wall biosynthesis